MLPALPHRVPIVGPWLLIALASTGCVGEPTPGDALPRVAVSGKVTLDGSPLPSGHIEFHPIGEGSEAAAVGEIRDGQFSIERPLGPAPGKYRVMISSRTPPRIAADQQPGGAPKPQPETIPKQYNTQSKLEVDVAKEGPLTFDFPLSKTP